MNFQNYIIIFAAGIAVGFAIGFKSCNHETTVKETIKITVHDTLNLKADTVYGIANHYFTKTIDGKEIHDTLLLRQIDTVFKREGIQQFKACLDTVIQDTFHLCYDYVPRSFAIRIGFAPRIHDTTVTIFPTHSVPFFSWHPIVGVEWNNGYDVAGGVAASMWILEGAAVLSIGATVQPRLSVMARF